jgi:hypothetical protein
MERLFEMDKKLYLVSILVEGLEHREDGRFEKNDDDNRTNVGTNDEGFDDLDNM